MEDSCLGMEAAKAVRAPGFAGQLIASKETPPHMYMKLNLEFEDGSDAASNIDDSMLLKSVLVEALAELHGDTGAAIPLDVLKYNGTTGEAIIRVEGSQLVKVWSSVTLFSTYKSCRCRINVQKVSPYLISLSKDSRLYEHKTIA